MIRMSSWIIAIWGVLAFVLLLLFSCQDTKTKLFPLTESWEQVVPHLESPEGLTGISAETCGSCHVDHYEEWKLSTHAHAWSDKQFQSEIKKESSPFFCINCHIPLQDQQAFIITGKRGNDIYQPVKVPNPHFDKKLQLEAITCAVCHIRDGAVVSTQTRNLAPHKTVVDKSFLSEQLCISCHNASAQITPELVCTFETGEEWKNGPYHDSKNCISCHMETRHKPIMDGYEAMTSHYHGFPGSGIPKERGEDSPMLLGLDIDIENLKLNYTKGDSLQVYVKLQNAHAGHKVPTGDPERFIRIQMDLLNLQGDTIVSNVVRIGEHWEWYPKAKKISDNNLKPKEGRSYTIPYRFMDNGSYILSVVVSKHRMDRKTANYNKLGNNYPITRVIYSKQHTIMVD